MVIVLFRDFHSTINSLSSPSMIPSHTLPTCYHPPTSSTITESIDINNRDTSHLTMILIVCFKRCVAENAAMLAETKVIRSTYRPAQVDFW